MGWGGASGSGGVGASSGAGGLGGASTTVHPTEIDDLLPNPGIGHRTFYVPKAWDGNVPVGVPTTDFYIRYDWADLEPGAGDYQFGVIDADLGLANASDQKLSLRIAPFTPTKGGPDWLRAAGAGGTWAAMEGQTTPVWVPHLQDDIVKSAVAGFVSALGQRYDGHPDLGYVDISFWGMYGEWHISTSITSPNVPIPSTSDLEWLVDQHVAAFPSTILVSGISAERQYGADPAAVSYAVGKGAGVFFDCWGDYGGGWNHMEDGYPSWIQLAGAQDAWQTGPINLETCGTPAEWGPGDGPKAFQWAIDQHASLVNIKSSALPAAWLSDYRDMIRRLGYRLTLREVTHPRTAKPGGNLAVAVTLENVGVAPSYYDHRFAVKIGSGPAVVSTTSIRGLLPGAHELLVETTVPVALAPGQHDLSLGVVDPSSGLPVVQLANSGRDADGWYPVSTIDVK